MTNGRWHSIMVVISDPFARDQPALDKAAAVALGSGARLVLFNSFMLPQPVSDVPMDARQQIIGAAIRQRRERLSSMVKAWGLSDVQCLVEWDYPEHEAVVRQVLRTKPDLVMTANHRRGRLARLLLRNTDWELMRLCPCPVWFVRSPELPVGPRVLVAVDPFHAHEKPARLDDRLLQTANVLRRQFDAGVSLIHASAFDESARPLRFTIRERAQQAVTDLGAKYSLAAEYCEVSVGQPEEVVPSAVRRDGADILVMGVVSRSAQSRPVIGNTAESVIDRVDCDLLVVKPPGFKVPAVFTQPAGGRNRERSRRNGAGRRRRVASHVT